MTISHSSVALQPRGLVNRANWCYINGTLQALVACPPFYNLLKKLPRYPALSRGPSSTPILDSLVEFAHEFHPMLRNMDKGNYKTLKSRFFGFQHVPGLFNMSHRMGKPTICIGENRGADQLRSNYTDSTIPLLSKSKISSL